jgi:hypothetical protein
MQPQVDTPLAAVPDLQDLGERVSMQGPGALSAEEEKRMSLVTISTQVSAVSRASMLISSSLVPIVHLSYLKKTCTNNQLFIFD